MTTAERDDRLAAAVAAFGLRGSVLGFPNEVLDDRRWLRLLHRIGEERLSGHLMHALETGVLPASADQRQQARELHDIQLANVLRLERLLLRVVGTLTSAGIDARVLKGPVLAHTAYADPSLRLFGDIDVLVPSDRFDDAVGLLVDGHVRRVMPRLRAGFDRRFGKGVTLVDADGLEIDLHRTFVPGYFGLRIDLDGLLETSATYEIAGRTLSVLGAEERFLQACYHAALGHVVRLVPLRDIAQMLLHTPIESERVLELARGWSGSSVVACAVLQTWETLELADVVPLSAWASGYEIDPADAKVLATYQGSARSERGRVMATVRTIDGWRGRLDYLRALFLPERQFLRRHGTGRLGWLTGTRRTGSSRIST